MSTDSTGNQLAPIGVHDLVTLDRDEVKKKNADLATLGRAVFNIGGSPLLFSCVRPTETLSHASSVWLSLEWNGAPLIAGVSRKWAESLTQQMIGQSLDAMNDSCLDLFGQAKLAPLMPPALVIRKLSRSKDTFVALAQRLHEIGCWVGRHARTQELSGHSVVLLADAGFALESFLLEWVKRAQAFMPSPLARLPITLPVVAANWSVPADQLERLCHGDVLVIN